ncbi:MAG: hypothetical protein COA53_09760 [Rhodobacteraceae bacterium]|nr:MAG: hypothetical protein COA53_09760 [Paracoccaceae bacterium]
MISYIRTKINEYLKDDSGTATIEFVLWFPLLMFWMLGIVVFFDAFKSRGALIAANTVVADIISRNSEVDTAYLDLLQLLQSSLLPKTSGGGLRISSILYTIDPDIVDDPGTYTVQWSGVTGTATIVLEDADIQISELPDMYSSETVLLVESFVPYVPMTSYIGMTVTTLRRTIAISPRYDSRVVWVN